MQIPKTKTYQDVHMVTASLIITVRDFKILEQLSKAITRTLCVASVNTIWSLTDSATTRLKIEVHELAARDALNKAIAIASSIGFQTVTPEEIALQSSKQALLSTCSHYSDGTSTRSSPHRAYNGRGCLGVDNDYSWGGGIIEYGASNWTSRDESGDLDVWTLVLVPGKINLTATVNATFSATSSTGWVYEEINQHRFLTR